MPPTRKTVAKIIGKHPTRGDLFSPWTNHLDGSDPALILHRVLTQTSDPPISDLRERIVFHHLRPETARKVKALRRTATKHRGSKGRSLFRRLPTSSSVRKGNFAEILLVEYVAASSGLKIPIYRLRYNPNADQSMKGEDMIAIDFDSAKPRILVGEAKFRGTPSNATISEITKTLKKVDEGKLSSALLFIADILEREGQRARANKVYEILELMAKAKIPVDRVGLLVGPANCGNLVQQTARIERREIVLLSLGLTDPTGVVKSVFKERV